MTISGTLRGYADSAAQKTITFVKECSNFRNNTDFFEKVGQVAFAALQLVMMIPGYTYLSRLSFSLSTVVMHDFYNFFKQPAKWMYPCTSDKIIEFETLTSLTAALQQQLDPAGTHGNAVADLAKKQLEFRLKTMLEKGDAYASEDVFKDVLQRQIRETNPVINPSPFNLKDVDLKDFKVSLRNVSFIERLSSWVWIAVDVGTIGYFFQKWQLLDTAKWAERIGKVPGFQWVPTNSFDTWVVGGICTGFGLKLVEASRKLFDEKMTGQERRQAKCDVITSIFESIYWGSMFMSRIGQCIIKDATLQWLAIAAKTLGLVSIIINSERHVFFQQQTAPAA